LDEEAAFLLDDQFEEVRIRLVLQKNGERGENRAFGHRCDDSNLQFSEDSSR
jgi:hypothetical protein